MLSVCCFTSADLSRCRLCSWAGVGGEGVTCCGFWGLEGEHSETTTCMGEGNNPLVSGGWREGVMGTCHMLLFLGFGGGGEERCDMLRCLKFGGRCKRCHLLRFWGGVEGVGKRCHMLRLLGFGRGEGGKGVTCYGFWGLEGGRKVSHVTVSGIWYLTFDIFGL